MVRNYRKPLIAAAPKVILRLPAATSTLAEMTSGTTFHSVLDDRVLSPSAVKKVVFVCGKHYYTLAKERDARGVKDMAIVRLEVSTH